MQAQVAIDQVEAKLAAGILMSPKRLFSQVLGMALKLPGEEFKRLVVLMYRLAVAKENWEWVERAQVQVTSFFSNP